MNGNGTFNYTQLMAIETAVYGMTHTANIVAQTTGKFEVTSYMLNHSVFQNGEDLYINENHFIGKKLKETNFYKNAISDAIDYSKNGIINYDSSIGRERGVTFGEGENDFANGFGTIHYKITGKIHENGNIETHFNITDTYKFYDLGDDSLIHNNIAWISQQNGLSVTPYTYYVDIYNLTK